MTESEGVREDKVMLEEVKSISDKIGKSVEQYRFREAMGEAMNIARAGNKYLADAEPWKLIKEEANKQAVADCLFTCIAIVKEIGKYGEIFLPETSNKILNLLNISSYQEEIKVGYQLGTPVLLFEKIEDETISTQMEKLVKPIIEPVQNSEPVDAPIAPIKSEIAYDDFAKLDVRVGTITAAEKVNNSDRLLNITLDIGNETRTV
jgi:methionyl-tRNA synthetase